MALITGPLRLRLACCRAGSPRAPAQTRLHPRAAGHLLQRREPPGSGLFRLGASLHLRVAWCSAGDEHGRTREAEEEVFCRGG